MCTLRAIDHRIDCTTCATCRTGRAESSALDRGVDAGLRRHPRQGSEARLRRPASRHITFRSDSGGRWLVGPLPSAQAVLVGMDDGLDAIPKVVFREHSSDMRLYRRLGEVERTSISAFDSPAAVSPFTSPARWVRSRTSSADASNDSTCGQVENRSTRSRVIRGDSTASPAATAWIASHSWCGRTFFSRKPLAPACRPVEIKHREDQDGTRTGRGDPPGRLSVVADFHGDGDVASHGFRVGAVRVGEIGEFVSDVVRNIWDHDLEVHGEADRVPVTDQADLSAHG